MTDQGFPTYGGRAGLTATIDPHTGGIMVIWRMNDNESHGIGYYSSSRHQLADLQKMSAEAIDWTEEQWDEWSRKSLERVRAQK